MPCRHGPRPTGWWRPTAPCSISMCGRCCGASMPRSTQASWGLSRRQCPTFPSWRPLTTPSTSSKHSQPRPSLRPLSPSPCRRVSRRQPRQGRRKPHRTDGGPRRARLKAPNPNPGLSLSLSSRRLCRISSNRRPGRRSKEERRRGLPAASRRSRRSHLNPARPLDRSAKPGCRHRLSSLKSARRCRCRRRPWKRNRRRNGGRGRQSSSGAWLPSSSWGSPPDYGCGLPSLVACSAPAPGQPGAETSNKNAPTTTDPNDPRSRKADRLPGPS